MGASARCEMPAVRSLVNNARVSFTLRWYTMMCTTDRCGQYEHRDAIIHTHKHHNSIAGLVGRVSPCIKCNNSAVRLTKGFGLCMCFSFYIAHIYVEAELTLLYSVARWPCLKAISWRSVYKSRCTARRAQRYGFHEIPVGYASVDRPFIVRRFGHAFGHSIKLRGALLSEIAVVDIICATCGLYGRVFTWCV